MSETALPTVDDVAEALRGWESSGMCHIGKVCELCDCGNPKTIDQLTRWRARDILTLFPGRTEAEIKAEALREAADDVQDGEVWTWDADRLCGLLRDRADRIEAEA